MEKKDFLTGDQLWLGERGGVDSGPKEVWIKVWLSHSWWTLATLSSSTVVPKLCSSRKTPKKDKLDVLPGELKTRENRRSSLLVLWAFVPLIDRTVRLTGKWGERSGTTHSKGCREQGSNSRHSDTPFMEYLRKVI